MLGDSRGAVCRCGKGWRSASQPPTRTRANPQTTRLLDVKRNIAKAKKTLSAGQFAICCLHFSVFAHLRLIVFIAQHEQKTTNQDKNAR